MTTVDSVPVSTFVLIDRIAELERELRDKQRQLDSAVRLANHAFTRSDAAIRLLREAVTAQSSHHAEAALGQRITRFLEETQ